jgi:hypothetical protein
MKTPNAIYGIKNLRICFAPFDMSNAPTDCVHLPIIRLAQNKEINGATLSVGFSNPVLKKQEDLKL